MTTVLAWLAYVAPIVLAVLYVLARLSSQDRRIDALESRPAPPGAGILARRLETVELQVGKLVPLSQYDGLAKTVSNHSLSISEFGDALADCAKQCHIDGLVKGIEAESAATSLRLVAAEAQLKGIAEAREAMADVIEAIPALMRPAP